MDRADLHPVLAVIPARGGSKGLPGKNVRPLAGLPLIAHSIRLARMCPDIDRAVVSTEDAEIARVARAHGGDVPFLRPAELARDDTPMWPVLRHAILEMERVEGRVYRTVVLLQPTNPSRLPVDVAGALGRLAAVPEADGVLAVSQPKWNPVWQSVTEENGWMRDLFKEATSFERRQDAPTVYRINGMLYVWRRDFLLRAPSGRRGDLLCYEVPEDRVVDIDDLGEFQRAEVLIRSGLLEMPWLTAEGTP